MTFEEKLAKLEELSISIKKPDVSIEEALKNFEDGIKISQELKKELDSIEGKIQILMNQPSKKENIEPQLDLFSSAALNSSAPEGQMRQY